MAPGEKSGEGSRNFRPQTGRLPGPSLRRLADLAKIWTCPSKNRPRPAPAPAIPFRAVRRSPGKARIALPEKNAALAKKKLAKGWGCLYTPFCAERSAPWQGSSVGQSMRFIPAVSRVQISPLLPESTTPDVPTRPGFSHWPCLFPIFCALALSPAASPSCRVPSLFKVYERAGPPPCLASRLAPALRVVPALPCWRLSQAEQRPKRLTELAFVPAGRHVEPRRGRPARALPFQASGQRPGAV